MNKQSYTHLKTHERDHLAVRRAEGASMRTVAAELGRNPSTISRECSRGSKPGKPYHSYQAQQEADYRRGRSNGQPRKLSTPEGLALLDDVQALMRRDRRSVQQALDILYKQNPARPRVCRQTVYSWMYNPSVFTGRDLCKDLIRKRSCRKSRSNPEGKKKKFLHMVSIHDRPLGAANRSEAGHLEGDLVIGKGHKSALITLADRVTRFAIVLPAPCLNSVEVLQTITQWFRKQAPGSVKSITWDQGREMAYHYVFTRETGVPVFFADAHSPWQRGLNENTNGVLRRYYPKHVPLPSDPVETARLSGLLNTRPMLVLSGRTPLEANSLLGGVALQS